jgi:hypothetical protein
MTTGPVSKSDFNEIACGKFAANSMNSGALSPTFKVELSLAIVRTVKQVQKPDNIGRNRGTKVDSVLKRSTKSRKVRWEVGRAEAFRNLPPA